MSAAQDCVATLRALGVEGPFRGTTLYETGLLGLRSTRAGKVVVSDLWVSPSVRGHGVGTQLLRLVTDIADLHGVPVQLRPAAFDRRGSDPTTSSLRRWYASHGFVVKGKTLMVRRPQARSFS